MATSMACCISTADISPVLSLKEILRVNALTKQNQTFVCLQFHGIILFPAFAAITQLLRVHLLFKLAVH